MSRPISIVSVLDGPAAADPARVALHTAAGPVTYGGLAAAARRCARELGAAGVRRGQRVPLVDDATELSVAALLGAPRLGAATALMNPRLTADELAALMAVAGTTGVVVAGPSVTAVRQVPGVTVLGPDELLGDGDLADTGDTTKPPDDEEAVVLFTSGTTGTPKPIPLTHGLVGPRIADFAPPFDPAVDPVVTLMCVPIVHIGGMLGLLVALARGHTTVVQTRFDAGQWLELVQRHRVSTSFLVPTMLHRILEHPDFDSTDLGSLALITYGAAPASPDLIRRAMAALPHVRFANTFGQTETLGSIATLGPDDHAGDKLTSVGRPLPGVEVQVVDPARLTPVEAGEVGELWVRTAASVITPSPPGSAAAPDGWLRTGDMVHQDEDGYLYPAGRLTDTINRGGEKFGPAEVEAVLRQHPAVRDVAVAGVADAEMGQRVGAAVVVRRPVTAEELRAFSRQRLASFKAPERLVFVDDLPYNDFGKVARDQLRAILAGAPATGAI